MRPALRLSLLLAATFALPTLAPTRDAASVYAKAKAAVVTVRTDKASGTGFVVGDGTLVLTCLHVVADASWIRTDSTGGGSVAVVGVDEARDVALLRLSRPLKRRLALRTGATPAPGTKVYAIGTPLGYLDSTITEGIVSGKRRVGNVAYLQITAPISHGSSGGPVLDEQARVVGMVDFFLDKGQGLNFAVSSYDLGNAVSGIQAEARSANAAARRAARIARKGSRRSTTPPSTPSHGGTVVLGHLGRAKQAAQIYAAPTSKAKVLSRIDKGRYLVVKAGGSTWTTVVMDDHKLAYIPTVAVETLAYEVTEDGSRSMTTGPISAEEPPNEDGADDESLLAGVAIAEYAKHAVGSKYAAAGASLEMGVGSGEFVMLAYAAEGYDLSPDPAAQATRGNAVTNYGDLRLGDRVYFWNEKAKKIDEAAIYIGEGRVVMADPRKSTVVSVYLDETLQAKTVRARRGAPRKALRTPVVEPPAKLESAPPLG